MDLKELKKLVKYLRSEGITEYKQGDLEFKLGPANAKSSKSKVNVSDQVNTPEAGPSREELLFWSAGGVDETPKDS